MVFFIRGIIQIAVLLLLIATAYGQKKKLDSTAFEAWPSMSLPELSEHGKYVAYVVNNDPVGFKTLTIKSLTDSWNKQIVSKNTISQLAIDDSKAVFKIGLDTTAISYFRGSTEFYKGYNRIEISPGSREWVIISKPDTVMLINFQGHYNFPNIVSSFFILNGDAVLLHTFNIVNNIRVEKLVKVSLPEMKSVELYSGSKLSSLTFNESKRKLSLLSRNVSTNKDELVVFDLFSDSHFVVNNSLQGYKISKILFFNKNDNCVVFSLQEDTIRKFMLNRSNLKIWRYTDEKTANRKIQEISPKMINSSVHIDDRRMILLDEDIKFNWSHFISPAQWGNIGLVSQRVGDCDEREVNWNPACKRNWYIVYLRDGRRKRISAFDNSDSEYFLSPNEKYIVFHDVGKNKYFSYSILDSSIVDLTQDSKLSASPGLSSDSLGYIVYKQRGIAGWSSDGNSVYIYDDFDIWKASLDGKSLPVNLTNGYGKKNSIVFSFLDGPVRKIIDRENELIISSLNLNTKYNGFYRTRYLKRSSDPQTLSDGPYIYYIPFYGFSIFEGRVPKKAALANIYVVRRESAKEFPNYFYTKDFKEFTPLSNYFPERKYNWMTSELCTWTSPDGKKLQGILYKPEDFDSTKKYPLIFNIYERQSNGTFGYIQPEPLCNSCQVNPPLLVSNGYLVFRPDIYYKFDKSGECALTSVESAVRYLSKFNWVDTSRLGIQGCSFGGFETNYIVTHSKIFKAACTASGVSDLFSFYSNELTYTTFFYAQQRMKKDIWVYPEVYIDNSPLYSVQNIVTPMLIFHTTKDDAVDFIQGLQLFLIMRRLNKKAWLLEYGNGNHGVTDPHDANDFSIRMQQFFDFYLKDSEMPKWMDAKNTSEYSSSL